VIDPWFYTNKTQIRYSLRTAAGARVRFFPNCKKLLACVTKWFDTLLSIQENKPLFAKINKKWQRRSFPKYSFKYNVNYHVWIRSLFQVNVKLSQFGFKKILGTNAIFLFSQIYGKDLLKSLGKSSGEF